MSMSIALLKQYNVLNKLSLDAISELADPFWAAWCEEGRISELDRVFSLFTSEMSSETATLKPLRWISELTSEEHSLK